MFPHRGSVSSQSAVFLCAGLPLKPGEHREHNLRCDWGVRPHVTMNLRTMRKQSCLCSQETSTQKVPHDHYNAGRLLNSSFFFFFFFPRPADFSNFSDNGNTSPGSPGDEERIRLLSNVASCAVSSYFLREKVTEIMGTDSSRGRCTTLNVTITG